MIEITEARSIAKDLRKEVLNKKIVDVKGNYTDHKFTFYYKDPNNYKKQLVGKKVTNIVDRNSYVELSIQDETLILRDGANIRYNKVIIPPKSKLCLIFDDGSSLNVTTSMYSFIALFSNKDNFDDKYYNLELNGIGPLDKKFTYEYFKSLLTSETVKLSAKAFIATNQRIPGIGNGLAQDILFRSNLHPKRKMNTLDEKEIKKLYENIISIVKEAICQGGRDTEKDIYGNTGGYKTVLNSKTYKDPCPVCSSKIIKENYLGGSIYYCPSCQKA